MGELLKLNSVKLMDYRWQKADFCNFVTEPKNLIKSWIQTRWLVN